MEELGCVLEGKTVRTYNRLAREQGIRETGRTGKNQW